MKLSIHSYTIHKKCSDKQINKATIGQLQTSVALAQT